jgi:hypothetical protein
MRSAASFRPGPWHPNAHFTEDDVLQIRALYAGGGITYRELAEQGGVSIECIHKIVTRKTWGYLTNQQARQNEHSRN